MTSSKLQVSTPSEREIAMTRTFDAPAGMVFDAWTKPELIKRWLGAFGGWTFRVCEVDLRVGGAYHYVWRGPDGKDMGMGGVYKEVVRAEKIVCTEKFEEAWYAGDATNTTIFVEENGKTTVTTTTLYTSKDVRDGVLKSPMERGVAKGYDKLAEVLASTLARSTK
ncbi:MAG: hypothetical protein QOK07_2765 [Gemmatimonadaceae bacterium]|nr:hypothetical protein [Gemmatimonadaceae bacterium]